MARRKKSMARMSASRKAKNNFVEQTIALGALVVILVSVLYMGEILKPAQVAPVQTFQQYEAVGASASGTVSVGVGQEPPQPAHSSATVMLVLKR